MEEVSANGILGERRDSVDLLVLGDSEAYSSVSPMELWRDRGYTGYVCGTSSQTLDYTLELLTRALEDQRPRVVLLETNAIYRLVPAQKLVFTPLASRLSVFRYHDRGRAWGGTTCWGRPASPGPTTGRGTGTTPPSPAPPRGTTCSPPTPRRRSPSATAAWWRRSPGAARKPGRPSPSSAPPAR